MAVAMDKGNTHLLDEPTPPNSTSLDLVVLRQLQHQAAAHILQGDTDQALVVMQELELRGKGLRWIKNFKSNIAKELAALLHEEGGRSPGQQHQDRELKELILSCQKEGGTVKGN